MDKVSKDKRSEIMSRVRSKNTKPEMKVRSALHKAGYRFRLHRKDLPGKPDIVLPKHGTVIFVHGCFWHRHDCKKATTPKSNEEYWKKKFERNVNSFSKSKSKLIGLGWKVLVVWECQTEKENVLSKWIKDNLKPQK